jgi:hypothetical protein
MYEKRFAGFSEQACLAAIDAGYTDPYERWYVSDQWEVRERLSGRTLGAGQSLTEAYEAAAIPAIHLALDIYCRPSAA